MKTSETSSDFFYQTLRYFDQTPRISNSEFYISHFTQNGKLKDENLRVFSKAACSNPEVSRLRVFGLVYSAKIKPQSWRNAEFDQNALRLFMLIKTTLIKVSYLERVLVT